MDNRKAYVKALEEAKLPVVPYIGHYTKQLYAIEETQETINEDGLIDITKLRRISKVILNFQYFQVKRIIPLNNSPLLTLSLYIYSILFYFPRESIIHLKE